MVKDDPSCQNEGPTYQKCDISFHKYTRWLSMDFLVHLVSVYKKNEIFIGQPILV